MATNQKKLLLVLAALLVPIFLLRYLDRQKSSELQELQHELDSLKAEADRLHAYQKPITGDLIFQASLSAQSEAIQLATKSKYSHCGLIFKDSNNTYVLEAVQPVKRTPLDEWIARGQDGKYVIKRLKNAGDVLTPAVLAKMEQIGQQFEGKDYDQAFEWSDEKLYCSELIWKIYQRAAGLEIGKLEKLSDFDLANEAVKQKMKERYGNKIPVNETVISPASIFGSELLVTVKSNQ